MKIILSLIIFMTLSSCNNTQNQTNLNNITQSQITVSDSDADFAKVDSNLISQYKDRLNKADANEKLFINELLDLIKKFKNRKLDTTVYTIGFISSDTLIDTIQTRIFLKYDTIWVKYNWIKNQDTLWKFQIKNPYFFISNCDLFNDKSTEWTIFTIGVFLVPPKIIKFKDYKHLISMSLSELDYLNKQGLNIDRNEYRQYILNFKGNLLEWGDQRYCEGLYIWYAPSKRLITYYQP